MSKSTTYRIHMQQMGYFEGDVTCECGLATGNTAHLMQCTLLAHWMTSTVSTIYKINAWRDGRHKFDGTMMMISRR